MRKKGIEKDLKGEKNNDIKSAVENYLVQRQEFIDEIEAVGYRDNTVPFTIRINKADYAFIIKLAEKYKLPKSVMASEILENALVDVIRHIGKEEYHKMVDEGLKEDRIKREKRCEKRKELKF